MFSYLVLHQIWAAHRPIIAAPNFLPSFSFVGPFRNEDDSFVVENWSQISDFLEEWRAKCRSQFFVLNPGSSLWYIFDGEPHRDLGDQRSGKR